MVSSHQPLGRESTVYVYVLGQSPFDIADQVIQAVTGSSSSFSRSSYVPWRIQNRYYSTTVQFRLVERLEQLSNDSSDNPEEDEDGNEEVPALLVLIDNATPLDTRLLKELDSGRIDIPLVVGYAPEGATSQNLDDLTQDCLSCGFEYIPFVHEDMFGSEGKTGAARIAEALQARMWPNSEMTFVSSYRDLSTEGKDIEHGQNAPDPPTLAVSQLSAPSQKGESVPGFDDDFAPFVSAATQGDRSTAFDLPSNLFSDDFDAEDSSDPTANLTSLFASLSGFREQAMSMSDEHRKDFAAEVAMRFAKQLDELVDSGVDELGADVESGDEHEENQEFREAMREVRRRGS